MSRRSFPTGLCAAGFHGKCPHRMQAARIVVKNGASSSRVIEIPELFCDCKCHKEATK